MNFVETFWDPGIFQNVRHYVPPQTLICLYNLHFIFSQLWYYSMRSLTYDSYLNQCSCSLYRRKSYDVSNSSHLLLHLHLYLIHYINIINLQGMLHLNISTFAYRAIHKLSPVYFYNYFTPNSSVHGTGTHQSTRCDLFFPLERLYGLQIFRYFGSKSWNPVPLFKRIAGSVSIRVIHGIRNCGIWESRIAELWNYGIRKCGITEMCHRHESWIMNEPQSFNDLFRNLFGVFQEKNFTLVIKLEYS